MQCFDKTLESNGTYSSHPGSTGKSPVHCGNTLLFVLPKQANFGIWFLVLLLLNLCLAEGDFFYFTTQVKMRLWPFDR